jgi:hypothetical protein
MRLPDHFVERLRAHQIRERRYRLPDFKKISHLGQFSPQRRKGAEETQRKAKQLEMEKQERNGIVVTIAIHRLGGHGSEFLPAFLPTSLGFLCVSSAPLRLCGED